MAEPGDPTTAELRALAEAATPVRPEDLMRYDHGGGRLAILRDGQRTLIADFYGAGPDREFYAATNPAAILSLLDQIDELRAALNTAFVAMTLARCLPGVAAEYDFAPAITEARAVLTAPAVEPPMEAKHG